MKRRHCLFIALFCIMVSCAKHNESIDIDIEKCMQTEKKANVEDIFDNITFIPIQSSDSSFLSEDASIKYIDDNNIYIETESQLLRFDLQGKYLNKIGRKGGGPGEYTYVGRVSTNEKGNIILSNINGLMEYNVEGKFLSVSPKDSKYTSMLPLEDSNVSAIQRNYDKNGRLEENLLRIDSKGRIINKQTIYRDSLQVQRAWNGSPDRYYINGIEYYRDEWSNEVKLISKDGLVEQLFKFNFGDITPNRSDYQDAMMRNRLGEQVAELSDWITNGEISFFKVFINNSLTLVAVNQLDNKCLFSKKYDENSDPNIIPGISFKKLDSTTIWPQFVDSEGNLYAFIDPGAMSDDDLKEFNSRSGLNIKIDDNYLLVKLF